MKKTRKLLLLVSIGIFIVTLSSCNKWLGDDGENGVLLNNASLSDVYVLYEYNSHSEYNRQNQLHLTGDSSFYYIKVTKYFLTQVSIAFIFHQMRILMLIGLQQTPSPFLYLTRRNTKEKHGNNWKIPVISSRHITFREMTSVF